MLAAGTRLGPYEVLAPLGAGGMGEVYRARDLRLGREVAIKVISSSLASDPDRIARFEREARAAGSLNDPHVCTVLDIGTHAGSPFVVMELLEGESLRGRLARGAVPVPKAIHWAAQAARGLAAAHAKGIVHRDLKPENLFLTSDGRIKVLDFGLAKLTRPEAVVAPGQPPPDQPTAAAVPTEPGLVLGTPGYMAPEQLRGEPADQRADLFALGAILHELLTGRRAFPGTSFYDTAHRILEEEPPPLAASGREIPRGLEIIVGRCLEKDPRQRFQSAGDLAFALESLISVQGRTAAALPAGRVAARGRRRWAAALLAVGALAVVTAAWLGRRSRESPPAVSLAPERIVVAVFENRTGDAAFDPLGRLVSDWIIQGLSRVEGLDVVPSTTLLFAQPDDGPMEGGPPGRGRDPLLALAEETGAGTVLSGAYYLQGDSLRFEARITDAVRRRLLHAFDPVTGAVAEPMAAIEAVRQQAMGAMAATADGRSYLELLQHAPRYDAYCEFIAGFELFMTDAEAALGHFQKASELDSQFLPPLFYQAFLLYQAGEHARMMEIVRRIAGEREQLSPYGRGWLDTWVAFAGHRYAEALQHIRAVATLAPRDPLASFWVGYLARLDNRPQETVDTFDAFGAPPYAGHLLGKEWIRNLCVALHALGRYEREFEEGRRALERYPDEFDLYATEARAAAALGRLDVVAQVVDRCRTSARAGGAAGTMMTMTAAELRAHGHREPSLALAAEAVAWWREQAERRPGDAAVQIELLDALRWAERWAEAEEVALALTRTETPNVQARGILGALAARRGDREEALRVSEELRRAQDPHLFGDNTYGRACIAALLGDRDGAVDLLRAALAEGRPNWFTHHSEIDLEPVWDYPPFRELLKPRG